MLFSIGNVTGKRTSVVPPVTRPNSKKYKHLHEWGITAYTCLYLYRAVLSQLPSISEINSLPLNHLLRPSG